LKKKRVVLPRENGGVVEIDEEKRMNMCPRLCHWMALKWISSENQRWFRSSFGGMWWINGVLLSWNFVMN